jgi:hypothetical protein
MSLTKKWVCWFSMPGNPWWMITKLRFSQTNSIFEDFASHSLFTVPPWNWHIIYGRGVPTQYRLQSSLSPSDPCRWFDHRRWGLKVCPLGGKSSLYDSSIDFCLKQNWIQWKINSFRPGSPTLTSVVTNFSMSAHNCPITGLCHGPSIRKFMLQRPTRAQDPAWTGVLLSLVNGQTHNMYDWRTFWQHFGVTVTQDTTIVQFFFYFRHHPLLLCLLIVPGCLFRTNSWINCNLQEWRSQETLFLGLCVHALNLLNNCQFAAGRLSFSQSIVSRELIPLPCFQMVVDPSKSTRPSRCKAKRRNRG